MANIFTPVTPKNPNNAPFFNLLNGISVPNVSYFYDYKNVTPTVGDYIYIYC